MRAPPAAIASRTPATLGAARLSMTTTSPGGGAGAGSGSAPACGGAGSSAEGVADQWAVEHQRSNDTSRAQAGHEEPAPDEIGGGRAPVTMRCGVDQALTLRSPAISADHVGGGPGLVEKDEGGRVHVALPYPPSLAVSGDIRPILLGRARKRDVAGQGGSDRLALGGGR